jgi:hypothetical protein
MGKERGFRGAKAEDASLRQCTKCYSKNDAPPPTCVNVLLEALESGVLM